jgi:hypothetical protein
MQTGGLAVGGVERGGTVDDHLKQGETAGEHSRAAGRQRARRQGGRAVRSFRRLAFPGGQWYTAPGQGPPGSDKQHSAGVFSLFLGVLVVQSQRNGNQKDKKRDVFRNS